MNQEPARLSDIEVTENPLDGGPMLRCNVCTLILPWPIGLVTVQNLVDTSYRHIETDHGSALV